MRSKKLIIVILGGLIALSPFSIDMYLPAFPAIAAALKTDIAHIGYSLTSHRPGLEALYRGGGQGLGRAGQPADGCRRAGVLAGEFSAQRYRGRYARRHVRLHGISIGGAVFFPGPYPWSEGAEACCSNGIAYPDWVTLFLPGSGRTL
jgi:hypothetical protein